MENVIKFSKLYEQSFDDPFGEESLPPKLGPEIPTGTFSVDINKFENFVRLLTKYRDMEIMSEEEELKLDRLEFIVSSLKRNMIDHYR